MRESNLRLSETQKARILAHLQFILEELEATKPCVIAGDFFPPKFRFGGDYLVAIDWEDKGTKLMLPDHVRFFIDPDLVMTDDLIDRLQAKSAALYKANGIFRDDSAFRPLHLDAMIFEGIYSQFLWNSEDMKHMSDKGPALIDRTWATFRMIEGNSRHYHYYKPKYEQLQGDVRAIEEALMAA